jgi:hypothetical protein
MNSELIHFLSLLNPSTIILMLNREEEGTYLTFTNFMAEIDGCAEQ